MSGILKACCRIDINCSRNIFFEGSIWEERFCENLCPLHKQPLENIKFCKIHRKIPAPPQACNFIKEDLAQAFSCEFCEIFKNTFFTEHLWWLLLLFEALWMGPSTRKRFRMILRWLISWKGKWSYVWEMLRDVKERKFEND